MVELRLPPLFEDVGEEGRGATLERDTPLYSCGRDPIVQQRAMMSLWCVKTGPKPIWGGSGQSQKKSLAAVQIKRE